MAKYYQFAPIQTAHTTLRFNNTGENSLTIKEFDANVVMLDGDQVELDALVAAQPVEISMTELTFDDFFALAVKSNQARFALENLEKKFKADVQAITGQVAMDEVVSWDKQEKLAKEHLLDTTKPASQLQAMADARGFGETTEALALKIVANAEAYESAYFNLLGKYQAAKKAIFKP